MKCDNPLHNIQVQADGRCHWCEGREEMEEPRNLAKPEALSRPLCDVLGIAKQEIDVYQMPDGDFAFANAGIISDGFSSREQAEIAAYKAVLNGVILTIESEHLA